MAEFVSVVDPGVKENFDTGARRSSAVGKGRYDLIPTDALRRVAVHYENGARVYGEGNWTKGIPMSRYLDSAMRHIQSYIDDARRGAVPAEDHLAAAAWNLLSAIATDQRIEEGTLPPDLLLNSETL